VKIFNQLRARRALLLGDFNIDRYILGEVSRISPEAPVPILRVHRTYDRPGGAGNAALGLKALGLDVRVMGRGCPGLEGVDLSGMVDQGDFPTPIKSRMVAESSAHQIMRVDEEQIVPLDPRLEQQLIDQMDDLLCDIDVIAVSDYGKGMVTERLMSALVSSGLPVVVDPKGRDFSKYTGSTLVKPNLREVYEAGGCSELDAAADQVMRDARLSQLLVTRASEGASLFSEDGRIDFDVQLREVRDVTGAGDTVLATLVCAMASGLSMEEAVHLSMVAAGIAVEHPGCVSVTLSDLAHRLFVENPEHKLFAGDDLFALSHILEEASYTVLALADPVGAPLLEALRRLPGPVVLFAERGEQLELLTSLVDVEMILVGASHLRALAEMVPPDQLVRLEGGALTPCNSLDSLLLASLAV